MSSYRQTDACPKFGQPQPGAMSGGASYGVNNYPRSAPIYAPAMIPPGMENPTQWSPYGTLVAHPYFGGWDGLGGRLMHVAQADSYDASKNAFPANGVNDQPNAMFELIRLSPTTSAHPGLTMASGASPVMVFGAPPAYGLQTTPIMALGS